MMMMITETNNYNGGVQIIHEFENGYGASVVKHKGSYGWTQDKWELAVLKDGDLCYTSGITNDLIGYLSDVEVTGLLNDIEDLENG